MQRCVGLFRDSQVTYEGLDCMKDCLFFSLQKHFGRKRLLKLFINVHICVLFGLSSGALTVSVVDLATVGSGSDSRSASTLRGWLRESELGYPVSTGQGTTIRFANEQSPFWFQ
jgi:hypothetical protein